MNNKFEKRAYEELINAIIMQAVEDIREKNCYARSAKDFLKSDWFRSMTKADGIQILKRLEAEVS